MKFSGFGRLWDDGEQRGLERANEGLEVDFGQWANVTPSAEFVAYNFIELRVESDDGRTIWRGLGELDRWKIDLKTKMKTVRDVTIVEKEPCLVEKVFPCFWLVRCEGPRPSELHGWPDHIQSTRDACRGIFCCNPTYVANQHRGAGCPAVEAICLKPVW